MSGGMDSRPPLISAALPEGRLLSYEISATEDGRRIQDFLMKRQGYSIRLIRRLKQCPGVVCLGGVPVRMVDRLRAGEQLTVMLLPDAAASERSIEVRPEGSADRIVEGSTEVSTQAPASVPIVYEDEDVMVYNKPPFLAIHPCRDYQHNTLADVFLRDMQARGTAHPVFRPVYRLDRDTDGLCVIAKNPLAASKLARAIEKDYTAIACGRVEPATGTIDAPIAQLEPHRMKRGVRQDGQRAITHYEVLSYGAPLGRNEKYTDLDGDYAFFIQSNSPSAEPVYTLLRLRLETGRTHQIRVHFAYIGHPLAGDVLYGGAPSGLCRQALTCTRVAFHSPTSGTRCEICINMQPELTFLLQNA